MNEHCLIGYAGTTCALPFGVAAQRELACGLSAMLVCREPGAHSRNVGTSPGAIQRFHSVAVLRQSLQHGGGMGRRHRRPGLLVGRVIAQSPQDGLWIKPTKQLGLWTAIDAAATFGSIAAALAFIITSEALLAGIPVVLPLVAWYAGRQKEGIQIEVSSSFCHGASLSMQPLDSMQ